MKISNLGKSCYAQFARADVMNALAKAGIPSLRHTSLEEPQALCACERARKRLASHYGHLIELLKRLQGHDVNAAVAEVKERHLADEAQIGTFYDALVRDPAEPEIPMEPGLALFIQTGNRSIALLPDIEASASEPGQYPVFMATRWQTVVGLEQDSIARAMTPTEKAMRSRIVRSNRLWQRERWFVLPASDTAETNEAGQAVYFNDISLHNRPLDGWVDAFWGVQSGVRLPVPIGTSSESNLVFLITTFSPDVFEQWDMDVARQELRSLFSRLPADLAHLEDVLGRAFDEVLDPSNRLRRRYSRREADDYIAETVARNSGTASRELRDGLQSVLDVLYTQYRKPVPAAAKDALVAALRTQFEEKLAGLSFAVSLLNDIQDSETSLLRFSMRMLQHFFYHNQTNWVDGVQAVLNGLHNVSESEYLRVQNILGTAREEVIGRLDDIVGALPNSRPATMLKDRFYRVKNDIDMGLSLLPDGCRVHQFLDAMESVQSTRGCVVQIERDPEDLTRRFSIHPFLLTAILDNLLGRPGVHLRAFVAPDEDSVARRMVNVTAFFPGWDLPPEDEENFFLAPLGNRKGYYFTAQVLWREHGTIEYYRLREESPCHAVIHLTIPIEE
jgi:hypothetical protein